MTRARTAMPLGHTLVSLMLFAYTKLDTTLPVSTSSTSSRPTARRRQTGIQRGASRHPSNRCTAPIFQAAQHTRSRVPVLRSRRCSPECHADGQGSKGAHDHRSGIFGPNSGDAQRQGEQRRGSWGGARPSLSPRFARAVLLGELMNQRGVQNQALALQ